MKCRVAMAVLVVSLALSGCLAPRPETVARNWRPDGAGGKSLGQLLAVSPGLVGATWESFDGPGGEPVVRLAAEYNPSVAGRGCRAPGTGRRPAARTFLLLTLSVSPGGAVDFVSATGQAYTEGGAYAAFPLDIGVIAALVARTPPLPCAALTVPGYL